MTGGVTLELGAGACDTRAVDVSTWAAGHRRYVAVNVSENFEKSGQQSALLNNQWSPLEKESPPLGGLSSEHYRRRLLFRSAQCLFDLAQPVGTLEDLTRFGTVGGAHNAVLLHQVDQVGGAAVADAQPALQQRRGSLAELDDQPNRVLVKLVVLAVGAIFRSGRSRGSLVLRGIEEVLCVLRLCLGAPELHDGVNLFFRCERRVQAMHAG